MRNSLLLDRYRETLAALGREFAFNDPQVGVEAGAEGNAADRNVELLLNDPRR